MPKVRTPLSKKRAEARRVKLGRGSRREEEDGSSKSESSNPYRNGKKHEKARGYLKPDKFDGTTPLEIILVQFDNCKEYNGGVL